MHPAVLVPHLSVTNAQKIVHIRKYWKGAAWDKDKDILVTTSCQQPQSNHPSNNSVHCNRHSISSTFPALPCSDQSHRQCQLTWGYLPTAVVFQNLTMRRSSKFKEGWSELLQIQEWETDVGNCFEDWKYYHYTHNLLSLYQYLL